MGIRTGTVFVLNFDPRPIPKDDLWIEVPGEYDQVTNTRRFRFKIGTGLTRYKYLPYGLMGEPSADAPAPVSGPGNVVGPATSTDNAVARFDGTTGKLIQNSVIVVSDTGQVTGILSLNGSTMPAAPGVLATLATNLTLFSSGAAANGQVATANGAGGITWSTPVVGAGDVVGPASAVDGHIVQFDGVTGKLIKDGLATSSGGNGAADSGKVPLFNVDGGLIASIGVAAVNPAFYAESASAAIPAMLAFASGIAPAMEAFAGSTGAAIEATGLTGEAFTGANDSIATPPLHIQNQDATLSGPLMFLHNFANLGLEIENDGGASWTSGTGAQTTATNLPQFASGTKGVVPAAPAIVGTTKFLREDGSWSVPPDTDTGITQLTGDGTAGPGSGSVALTVSRVNGVAFSGLATGILKNTTGTGVPSIAAQGTDYYAPGGTDVAITDGGTGASTADGARTNLLLDRYSGVLTGDQTFPSTTLADITSLSGFSLAAAATYHFTFNGLVNTSANTVGILVTMNASAAISTLNCFTEFPTSATAWSTEIITALQGGTVSTSGPGATNRKYTITGSVTTSGACTFAFQAKSEDGTTVTIKRGSNCLIVRTA